MSRIKKVLVMALLLVVVGMIAAETLPETLARHEQMIYTQAGAFDSQQALLMKLNRDIKDLYGWTLFFLFVSLALIIWLIFQSVKAGHNSDDLHRTSVLVASNIELCAKIEALSQQNRDLINRHEELIKVMFAKMGTSGPIQNIVLQQPKPIAKPSNQIVEFNPNSQDDQTWLAKQKRQRPQ